MASLDDFPSAPVSSTPTANSSLRPREFRAVVRLDSGAASGGFYVRAYFYDGDNNLIHEWKKPPQVEIRLGGTYTVLPPRWEDATDYDIYFPIPPDIDRGPNRWKTAIIVFGNSHAAVADVYPGNTGDLNMFTFPKICSFHQPRTRQPPEWESEMNHGLHGEHGYSMLQQYLMQISVHPW